MKGVLGFLAHHVRDSPESPSAIGSNEEVILIEDFDEAKDKEFLDEVALPYF